MSSQEDTRTGLVSSGAKDLKTKIPPIAQLQPPKGAKPIRPCSRKSGA